MGDQKRTRASNSPVPVDPKRRRKVSIGDDKRPRESNSPVPIQRGIEVLMPDQSKDLPEDLIISIAKLVLVASFEEFSVFGAVCRSWKSAADRLKKNYLTNTTAGLGSLTNQVPLLVLPPTNRWNEDDGMVKFFSLTKGKTYKHSLPETARKECYSSLGWLLTLSDQRREGLQCHLVHPLNRTNIQLPDLRYPYTDFISKFVLSSSPSWTFHSVVMCATAMTLEFCRPGMGIDWTHINPINPKSTPQLVPQFEISDLLYYKGQFYVVDLEGCVLVCDIENPKTSMVAPEIPSELSRVFEVPFSNEKSWSESEVKNLGSRTVFLSGRSSSFSIDSSGYSRCKPNCIYFNNSSRDCYGLALDAGILNMEDGTIDQGLSKSFGTDYEEGCGSNLWVQLSF
ncbi:hypothetical protein ACLB2K_010680 [Fragaria x ananassa]